MEDCQIVELYWQRSEQAIAETAKKYGSYCHAIAYQILNDAQDSEECVSDTYMKTWNLLPPRRPAKLAGLLAKITRNLSLDRYRRYTAQKRGGGQMPLALEELSDCIPASWEEAAVEKTVLTGILNEFLAGLPKEQRKLFLGRYWYARSIQTLAQEYGFSQSKVKMTLLRLRKKLAQALAEEGIFYE